MHTPPTRQSATPAQQSHDDSGAETVPLTLRNNGSATDPHVTWDQADADSHLHNERKQLGSEGAHVSRVSRSPCPTAGNSSVMVPFTLHDDGSAHSVAWNQIGTDFPPTRRSDDEQYAPSGQTVQWADTSAAADMLRAASAVTNTESVVFIGRRGSSPRGAPPMKRVAESARPPTDGATEVAPARLRGSSVSPRSAASDEATPTYLSDDASNEDLPFALQTSSHCPGLHSNAAPPTITNVSPLRTSNEASPTYPASGAPT